MWIKLSVIIDRDCMPIKKTEVLVETKNVAYAMPSLFNPDHTVIQFVGSEDNFIVIEEAMDVVKRALIFGTILNNDH